MDIRTIQLKKTILENNDQDAEALRRQLKEDGTFYVNVMSSPGSGKTTMLVASIRELQALTCGQEPGTAAGLGTPEKPGMSGASGKTGAGETPGTSPQGETAPLAIGVMEADIDSDVDARAISEQTGVPSIQLHTGGMCHLDAEMSRQGLREIGSENLELVFLENVGNLVCPAEFDTGAHMNAVLLSVPEGDDKPLKYPLMFTEADVVLVTKTDAMPAFDFDKDRFCQNLAACNAAAPVFFISARTGEGVEDWCRWLIRRIRAR